ncbi:MAG: hypothetical protein HKN47_27890 [Pirellulaceae bacterium]|nr:hypothetical protein [Pirellulaceae bacterium]
MTKSSHLRLYRTVTDIVASGVGAACLIGATMHFVPSLYPMLLFLSLVFGSVAGFLFACTHSNRNRKNAGGLIVTMCVLQLICHWRLYVVGAYASSASSMVMYSIVSIALLMCWLVDRSIRHRINETRPWSIKQRAMRLFVGLIGCSVPVAVVVGTYMALGQPLPKLMISILHTLWHLALGVCCVVEFWRITGNELEPNPFERSVVAATKKGMLCGVACLLASVGGYSIAGGEPDYLVALTAVLFSVTAAAMIVRHRSADTSDQSNATSLASV